LNQGKEASDPLRAIDFPGLGVEDVLHDGAKSVPEGARESAPDSSMPFDTISGLRQPIGECTADSRTDPQAPAPAHFDAEESKEPQGVQESVCVAAEQHLDMEQTCEGSQPVGRMTKEGCKTSLRCIEQIHAIHAPDRVEEMLRVVLRHCVSQSEGAIKE